MKNLISFFVTVLLIVKIANAEPGGLLGSSPSVVDKSPASKSCPPGYKMLGKECGRTVTEPPMKQCRVGYTLVSASSDQCVQYSGKNPSCLDGYNRVGGSCIRITTVPSEETCPPEFFLNSQGDCVRPQRAADLVVCPPGSVQRGEICTTQSTGPPQLVCPDGFQLEGKRCNIEEIYDCTPERKHAMKRNLGVEKISSYGEKHMGVTARGPAPPPPSSRIPPPPGKDQSIYVDDYVLKATCKRVRSEPARKVCPNGVLDGKLCLIEVEVRSVVQPGPIFEDFAASIRICPSGFTSEPDANICSLTQEIPVDWNCREGTQDIGERCANYVPCNYVCESGFALEGDTCVQTQFVPPLVEYTVKYACVGKECENHH